MLAKLAFVIHAKIEKISKKYFVMIIKDGGEEQFLDFMGGTAVMRGDIELMGVPPFPPNRKTLPGMTVYGRSAVVSPAFKKQFYKELQTPFLMENNNKNNRTIETKQ